MTEDRAKALQTYMNEVTKLAFYYHSRLASITYILFGWFLFNILAKALDWYKKFFFSGGKYYTVQYLASNVEALSFWV